MEIKTDINLDIINETRIIETNKNNLTRSFNSKLNRLDIYINEDLISLFYSYTSLIAIGVNNIVYLDSYYYKYSSTTNRHLKDIINNFDDYLYINSDDFNYLVNNLVILNDFKYLASNRIKLLKICLVYNLNNFYAAIKKFNDTLTLKLNLFNSSIRFNELNTYKDETKEIESTTINLKTRYIMTTTHLYKNCIPFRTINKYTTTTKKSKKLNFKIQLINDNLHSIEEIRCY